MAWFATDFEVLGLSPTHDDAVPEPAHSGSPRFLLASPISVMNLKNPDVVAPTVRATTTKHFDHTFAKTFMPCG
jgi:hypothetical protein